MPNGIQSDPDPAAVAAAKAEADAQAATQATRVDYDKAYYQAMLDTAKGAPDRWRSAAEFVQKAATAVGTIYAAILGSAATVSGRPLPARGVFPAVFLGLAIAMSTVYVAYSTRGTPLQRFRPTTSPPERMRARLNQFLTAVHESVERRVYWLRASVLALGVGVLLLPAPFISFSPPSVPNLDSLYPWPSPPAVRDQPTAMVVSIVYKARVDDVAAQRQRAVAAIDSTSSFWTWTLLAVVGLVVVLLVPLLSPFGPALWRWVLRRVPRMRQFDRWLRTVLNRNRPPGDPNLPYYVQ
ncbi:MAG TPA: hypothetical protein VLK30_01595 [Candidatus Limnocylindrales bacterium]|nr:hypothetical protein [Candidatus Limnocylindrales bacterium]